MFQKTVLPNGVRVLSESIPYVKSIALGIWIGTGSRYETDYNHGISHFIEHLIFKGTKTRSAKDIAETVDAVGGQLNAFTAKEHTCYYIKVLDTHLDLGMDILSDMLLASKFDPEDINREREVVIEEIHMYEDSPDELVHDIHLDKVWSGHPLGRNILGTTDSVSGLDRDKIKEYYHSHYTADNLVIACAGNLRHETLVELATKYFGHLSGIKNFPPETPPVITPTRSIYTKETEQVHLCLGTVSVPQNSPDLYTAHILNNILGGGISSRLFQSIREDRGLAYSVYSYQTNYSNAGLFTVYAGTRPSNTSKVIDLVIENIADVKNNGITAQELSRAKEQLKGALLLGLESSSSRMSRIGKLEISLGKYITMEEVVAKIEQVTLQDLNRMANELFTAENLCLTVLGPVKETVIPKSFTGL
jgi:predicted Zn-dependent peptidase